MGEAGPSPALSRNGRVGEQVLRLPAAKPDYPPYDVAPCAPSGLKGKECGGIVHPFPFPFQSRQTERFFVLAGMRSALKKKETGDV